MSSQALPDVTETLVALQRQIEQLEARVAALESEALAATAAAPAAAARDDAPPELVAGAARVTDGISGTRLVALLGRSFLVLAGAFLLRALTDRGILPPAAGFALGLGYALVLILLADRAGGRGDRLGGNAHGLTALIVAFPFVWETTAKLGLVSSTGGGVALAGLAAAGLAVSWHRRLRFQYWAFTLGALATTVALNFATGAAIFYGWLLLALGAATAVFAYNRRWYLARWPVALVADAIILRLAVMTSNPEGATAAGHPVSAPAIQLLALALLVVYIGLFTYRALVQGRGVRAFDVVQSLLVIAVGFGGASHVARHGGGGVLILGWSAMLAALAGYTIAFTVVRQRHGRGRAFFYFASLALLFLVLGSRLVVSGQWLAWSWIGLGLAAAVLGGHFDRVTLRAHSAVYMALAAVQTGLLAATLDAFLAAPDTVWTGLGASALVALAATGACYAVLVRTSPAELSRARRTPRFFVALLTLMGIGYVAVTLLLRASTDAPPQANPGAVAVVRTGVLAITAVVLALVGRRQRFAELAWLVYPVLLAGIAKVVLEDLAVGNPVALTIGFALYGGALIMAPRLLHAGRRERTAAASD